MLFLFFGVVWGFVVKLQKGDFAEVVQFRISGDQVVHGEKDTPCSRASKRFFKKSLGLV